MDHFAGLDVSALLNAIGIAHSAINEARVFSITPWLRR